MFFQAFAALVTLEFVARLVGVMGGWKKRGRGCAGRAEIEPFIIHPFAMQRVVQTMATVLTKPENHPPTAVTTACIEMHVAKQQ